MKNYLLYIITITTCLVNCTTPATAWQATQKPAVKMQARAYPNQIKLRWAPTTAIGWQYGNQYGYTLEKYLMLKNEQVLAKPQKISTSPNTFKPLPLKAWEKVVNQATTKEQNYALATAQALYGESFGLATGKTNHKFKKISNQVKEQQMRFTYALLASDRSPVVAQASGLAWHDNQVKKGEKYLYKVFINLPAGVNYRIDTAYVYAGTSDYHTLPQPVEFSAVFGNRTVMLTWNHWYHQQLYVAYQAERSADGGKTYQNVTNTPVGNVLPNKPESNTGIRSRYLFLTDSLPANGQTYHYRIRGINSFGETGPPSEAIAGQGWVNNLPLPRLSKPQIQANGHVYLAWSFPKVQEKNIMGFVVEKAPRAKGIPYQAVHKRTYLPPATRHFTDTQANGVAYYRVGILNKKPLGNNVGKTTVTNQEKSLNYKYTYPFLVQRPDSLPPQAPAMVSGTIDNNGKVTLRWQAPPDHDVEGYRIYRANYASEAFSQVTRTMVTDTSFVDSVALRTLTTQVFYKVQAVDHYLNPSAFSKAIMLKRPDLLPPVAPVFSQVISSDSGVCLSWQPSTSPDVARHALYRQQQGKYNKWVLIQNIVNNLTHQYVDTLLKTGINYQYTLVAVDSNHLESPPAKPVTGRKTDNRLRGKIEKLKASTSANPESIKLSWKYTYAPQSFSIYRGEEFGQLRLYATTNGKARSWKDPKCAPDRSYKYRIRANFSQGATSRFSQLVVITF